MRADIRGERRRRKEKKVEDGPTIVKPPTVTKYQIRSSLLRNLGFAVSSCLMYWKAVSHHRVRPDSPPRGFASAHTEIRIHDDAESRTCDQKVGGEAPDLRRQPEEEDLVEIKPMARNQLHPEQDRRHEDGGRQCPGDGRRRPVRAHDFRRHGGGWWVRWLRCVRWVDGKGRMGESEEFAAAGWGASVLHKNLPGSPGRNAKLGSGKE